MADNKNNKTRVTDGNDEVEKYKEAFENFCKKGRNSFSEAEYKMHCAWLERHEKELYSSNKTSIKIPKSLTKVEEVVSIPTVSDSKSPRGNIRG